MLLLSVYNAPGNKLIHRLGFGKELDPPFLNEDIKCTDIKALQGFDLNNFPYLFTRSKDSINLLDVKERRSYPLYTDRKPDFDNEYLRVVH